MVDSVFEESFRPGTRPYEKFLPFAAMDVNPSDRPDRYRFHFMGFHPRQP
jgi:hypothetical protein